MAPAAQARRETATCIVRDQNLACSIRDLSVGGARLVLDNLHSLRPNQSIKLLIEPIGFIGGRIAWSDGRNLGLKFGPLDQPALNKLGNLLDGRKAQRTPFSREHERFSFDLPTLCFVEEIWSVCQLLDVSDDRALVGFDRVPQVTIGERADLKRRGTDRQAGRVDDKDRRTLAIRLLGAE